VAVPSVPVLYLIAAIVGVLFTVNAFRPAHFPAAFTVPSFFAGWLTSELPIHHIVWQAVASAVFIALGALSDWPGWVALGLTLVSWVGLVQLARLASMSEGVTEQSLVEVFGPDYRSRIPAELMEAAQPGVDWRRLVLPFSMKDPEVEVTRNVVFHHDGRLKLKLDVYRNRAHPVGAPVLLYLHGGAWVFGDKREQGIPMMTHLASHGWLCITANYRLAPRSPFPAQIVDAKRAIAWVKQHAAEYGGDPEFVAISGGSAGGHLSALAALTPNEPEWQPGFEDADTSVSAAVPFYGIYDFTNREGLGHRGMRRFLERSVMKKKLKTDREAFEAASPMYRVGPDAPPFFVVHGRNDTLVPVKQARLFVKLLRDASRSTVAYAEIPGAQHAFEIFKSVRTAHVVQAAERFLAVVRAGAHDRVSR
jgi:acetyl esterase/lipase